VQLRADADVYESGDQELRAEAGPAFGRPGARASPPLAGGAVTLCV
jgi:hypothetical protein